MEYRVPEKRVVDALVDLPFALPTAVAGITGVARPSDLACRLEDWHEQGKAVKATGG